MYPDEQLIQTIADLIVTALDDVTDEVDDTGCTEEDAELMKAVLGEMNRTDLALAVRAAADRLPEPTDVDED